MENLFDKSHEDWVELIKLENDLLSKPLSDQPLDSLKAIRDILKRRIEETNGGTGTISKILSQNKNESLGEKTDKVIKEIEEIVTLIEERADEYPKDLEIVEGLIKKREAKKNNTP